MSNELIVVLSLLVAAIVMFAINKPRMDAVALIMLVALPVTGTVTMGEALLGFSDPNIVLIAAMFVVGNGLVRTGVARKLGDWLTARAGNSETKLVVFLMIVVCGLGSTMSSTAVTAIFIPVILRISSVTGTAASKLMMPLSMAALISGMMTLVATTPNLVVNSELVRHGEEGFRFFSFTPFGLPVLALAIIYMLFARRWLPDAKKDPNAAISGRPSLSGWVEQYKLAGREHQYRIGSGSILHRQTIQDIALQDTASASLILIQRNAKLIHPTPTTELLIGDILLLDSAVPTVDVSKLTQKYTLESMPLSGAYFSDRTQEIGMAEVILPADSEFISQTIIGARFRDRTGLTVIGLRRGRVAQESGLQDEKLKVGDTLLLIGPWKSIQNLQNGGKGVVALSLPVEFDEVLPVAGKVPQAVFCLFLVVGLMVSGLVPNVQAALLGCLLMGALGCVTLESSYRSIDWKTIVLIVGMLPFSTALQRVGGVDLAAEGLMSVTRDLGTHGVLATLFVITAILGMFISNTATAVLMAPVALAMADESGASAYPFAMIVALAASTAFMTPVSSPVNTLVVTPGDYSFGDFVKIGVPFSVVVMIVAVIMVPLLLPLYATVSP